MNIKEKEKKKKNTIIRNLKNIKKITEKVGSNKTCVLKALFYLS